MTAGPLEQALDFAPTGIAILTGDGRVRWTNRRLCRMLRRGPDDLVDADVAALVHPDDFEAADVAADVLAVGDMRDRGRKRYVRPDGSIVWGGLAVSRLPDEAAGPVVVMHVNDLSDLVRAEEQLGMVVLGLDDGIVAFDPQGRIASTNPSAARLLGIEEAGLVGEVHAPDFPMVDERGDPIPHDALPPACVARTGAPAYARVGVRTDDGDHRWLDVAAHPVERANGERWVIASYRDVSEHRRVEAALRRAVEAEQAKGEFLSRMSHELRTPLNAVLGFAQLLQMDELEVAQRESVDQILAAGRHLLGLLDEVLDLERIERGRVEVALQAVPIDAALRETVELVQPLAVATEVRVRLRADAVDRRVLADPQRLRQVLLNLLTNAIKYNRRRGAVVVSCSEVDGTVVVRVRDTGLGIDPAELGRIFVPFERLGAEDLGIEGTGVGLALSKRIVEAMGGRIGVESSVGVGSTFWFVLQAADDRADDVVAVPPVPLSDELAAELVRKVEGPPPLLLYIEDNAASRELVTRLVRRHQGFELVAAADGEEGLRLAQQERPRAILLDLHLPDRSGEDVLRALREDPLTRETPVIVLSADATPARRQALAAIGAVEYLTKPLDVGALFTALESACAGEAI